MAESHVFLYPSLQTSHSAMMMCMILIKFDRANQQASMMNPSPISQVKLSQVHRRKHNTEPRHPSLTQNDGRKCMRGSTASAQSVTRGSSIHSGMSTAASSATTNAQHRVPEKGKLRYEAPSIPPPWNCSSSDNPHQRRGLGQVFQSDSDWKVVYKAKNLAKLTGHHSASNILDPTSRGSSRRSRSYRLHVQNCP